MPIALFEANNAKHKIISSRKKCGFFSSAFNKLFLHLIKIFLIILLL